MRKKSEETKKKDAARAKQFNEENYDLISFRAPKGARADYKKAADSIGQSLTSFIREAVEEKYQAWEQNQPREIASEADEVPSEGKPMPG